MCGTPRHIYFMAYRLRNKHLRLLFILVLLAAGAGGYFLHSIAPYFLLQPPRVYDASTPQSLGLQAEAVELLTQDSIKLRGYHCTPAGDSAHATVIILHGVASCKEHMLGLAGWFNSQNIAAVVLDSRAHGSSGGTYCTYGYYERNDVSQLVDWLQQRSSKPIGIWGGSMGGAIAMQALGNDKRLAFGMIESTFTDLRQIVFDYQQRLSLGIAVPLAAGYVLDRADSIAGFDPNMVRPLEAANAIEQPMFMAHGTEDKHIKPAYGQQLYNALASKHKVWYPIDGAHHNNMGTVGGAEYKAAMQQFLDSVLPPR